MIVIHSIIDRIRTKYNFEKWIYVIDFSVHTGADVDARLEFLRYLGHAENLLAVILFGTNPLMRVMARLAGSTLRPRYKIFLPNTVELAFQQSRYVLEGFEVKDKTEESEYAAWKHEVEEHELKPVLLHLGGIRWDQPGKVNLELNDLHPVWHDFFNSIEVIKNDLDMLNEQRTARLEKLRNTQSKLLELQEARQKALEESQLQRKIFEVEYIRHRNLNAKVIEQQKEMLFSLGEIIETRSKETANHIHRVAEYSRLLARLWGLDETQQMQIYHASPMHDAGKLAIPDVILNKPGKFNDDEFAIMKSHSMRGFEMFRLSKREILSNAAIIARQHHEKFNGRGYPDGLVGEGIHPFGRIVALADVFDALGSDRCYKKAWPMDKILDLLRSERGEHFDPHLVDLFFANQDQFTSIQERLPDVHG